jgi:hypothetical protein
MLKYIYLLAVISTSIVTAFADVPRPDGSSNRVKGPVHLDTYLSIKLDRTAKDARLVIPRSQLKELRAELDAIEAGPGDTAAVVSTDGISRTQTIVSGAFLSLAMVVAGVWYVRRGKVSTPAGKSAAVAIAVLSAGVFATMVYGNAGPPAAAREISGKMFSQAVHMYKFGGGKIKLEVSATETQPTLIVPDPESTPAE